MILIEDQIEIERIDRKTKTNKYLNWIDSLFVIIIWVSNNLAESKWLQIDVPIY